MKKASDLIEQIFSTIKMDEKSEVVSLFHSWENIAGSDIASHSSIVECDRGTLIIRVDHPGWIQLIDIQKKRLLRGIQASYPDLGIVRLHLILG